MRISIKCSIASLTLVVLSDPDPCTLIISAKDKLNRMNEWCIQNGMKIYWSKSNFMFFYNERMKHPPVITQIDVGTVPYCHEMEKICPGLVQDTEISTRYL
jgi:hypothetical protein